MPDPQAQPAAASRLRRLWGWSPAPVIRASLWLHAGSLASILANPAWWPEACGLLAANHAALAGGMHPRGQWLGRNLTRLPTAAPAVALTFDDGPDPAATPRILDLLDRHGAKASFFVIGRRAARHPALLREMLRRGHAVENHTHRHPLSFACWPPGAMLREIDAAQQAIADACGRAPTLFRAPAGIRSPLLDPVLAVAGLTHVSWTRRGYDAVCREPGTVLRRLTAGLGAGDILLLHDGRPKHAPARAALAVLPPLLARLAERGLSAVSLSQALKTPALGEARGGAAAPAAAAASPAPAGYASR